MMNVAVGRGASASSKGVAQLSLLGIGVLILLGMSIAAHSLAYFPIDPGISRSVQAYQSDWLDRLTAAISWTGFPPQSDVLFGIIVVVLFVVGARWAAVCAAAAAIGSGGLYLVLQQIVGQPRPSADLVRVAGPLQMTGFPSGHLATFTAVFGFLAYLGYRRLGRSPARWVPVALVVLVLAAMSFARIYAGQHWASDVFGGCLLGALWLSVTIHLYTWGETRFRWARPKASRG